MRTTIARLATLFVAALTLAACRDTNLLAPARDAGQQASPSKRFLGNPLMSITAGANHTCMRFYLGGTLCWGLDDDGQLGIGPAPATCALPGGSYACATTPAPIQNIGFGAISAGVNHTCGIQTPGNTAWCWGGNSAFQLGTGDITPSNVPRQVASTLPFSSISAGAFQSCGTVEGPTPQGTLMCWGQDHTGGPQKYVRTPTAVDPPAGVASDFHGVTVGWGTVCSFWSDNAVAQLFCMGNNDYGEAGVDPQIAGFVTLSAVQVTPASSAAIGLYSACVQQQGGAIACWGSNNAGQLGNPQAGAASFVPVTVASPVALHGVVVASFYACALDASGNAWCWGSHSFDGTSGSSPMMLPTGHTFTSLAAGSKHVCGIGTDKHVWCWGDDSYGQLGDGRPALTVPATQPVQVSGT